MPTASWAGTGSDTCEVGFLSAVEQQPQLGVRDQCGLVERRQGGQVQGGGVVDDDVCDGTMNQVHQRSQKVPLPSNARVAESDGADGVTQVLAGVGELVATQGRAGVEPGGVAVPGRGGAQVINHRCDLTWVCHDGDRTWLRVEPLRRLC
ncbi:hypothetical protein [Nocardioides sp. AX2bis]|uniref:hypothetical protein n=1 Tax=Nocardioides sp. AX2bis TaxID=2653157 RepID=UPI0013582CFD|nr:hypothetical protein [Nocardioides sp. AX2bis]